mmetsp:Transcript_73052/g.158551  ORF Transcript_73052/g.158551 Transcript_73052/m.158551 type:complete len:96 (+) Transcript_73052:382-669(+)
MEGVGQCLTRQEATDSTGPPQHCRGDQGAPAIAMSGYRTNVVGGPGLRGSLFALLALLALLAVRQKLRLRRPQAEGSCSCGLHCNAVPNAVPNAL